VEAVDCAAAAMRSIRARPPDILLSDIGMPVEDGYALIQQVRAWEGAAEHAVPAIAVTAYARPEDRTAALRAGFNAHVHKPVEPMQLASLVGRLARRA
jgi:CheY-like chemotaxis protein